MGIPGHSVSPIDGSVPGSSARFFPPVCAVPCSTNPPRSPEPSLCVCRCPYLLPSGISTRSALGPYLRNSIPSLQNVIQFETGLVPHCVEPWPGRFTRVMTTPQTTVAITSPLRPHETPPAKSCWCGDAATYVIPGTAYFYCTSHADATHACVQRWSQIPEGRSHAAGRRYI